MTSARLGYLPALDGLRAVAITLVVAYHSVRPFRSGQAGVDVFFVLSGFLITALIAEQIHTRNFSRRRFYAHRAIRLVPALLVMVAVFTPLGLLVGAGKGTLLAAVLALTYLMPITSASLFAHTWSLAVEEWFYLLWPVVLAKLFRDRLTLRQAAVLAASLAVVAQGALILAPGTEIVRPFGLLAGCSLALWWLDGGRVARPSLLAGGGTAVILVGTLAPFVPYGPAPYWAATGGTLAVIGGLVCGGGGIGRRVLELRMLVAIGVVSYEWYLLHAPTLKIGYGLWGPGSYWVTVPLSFALAYVLHHALRPLQRRMRDRLDCWSTSARAG